MRYKTSNCPNRATGQVLVDVRAAGTNPIDYKLYSGDMGRDPARLPMPIGMEVAGVVVAAGARRAGIHRGTDGRRRGRSSPIAAAGTPSGCSPTDPTSGTSQGRCRSKHAAGLLLVGGTAWHLLTNTDVGMNDTVLIHGASGGVGLMAVQLAVARGARVIATASPARHDQLRGYGAEPVAYGAGLADRVRAIGPRRRRARPGRHRRGAGHVGRAGRRQGRIATIVGFGRAAELGIAALTGADGGQAIRDASRPELLKLAADGQAGSDGGQGLSVGPGGRSPPLPADRARPRQSRTGSLAVADYQREAKRIAHD